MSYKVEEQTKEQTTDNKQSGIILTSYKNFINWLYISISSGMIGRFFTMYSLEENKLNNGMFAGFFNRIKNVSVIVRKITKLIASQFEKSMFLNAIRQLISWLISRQMKFYGTFVFSFGTYSVLSYILKRYFMANVTIEYFNFITGLIMMIVSLPMFFSSKPLSELLEKSVIMRSILIETLGISEESFSPEKKSDTEKYALPFLLGIAAGIITYFFGSLIVILSIVALVAISLIIVYTEIGILCIALLTPIFAQHKDFIAVINVFIIATAISYLLKLLRGKRTIQFKLLDLIVLMFGILVIFGGIFTVGSVESKAYATNLAYLMLSYFLIVNLIKTREWMLRCTITLISSAVFISVVGLSIQFFNRLYGIDFSFSNSFIPLLLGLIENSKVLALLLVFVLPFTISYMLGLNNLRTKISIFIINCILFAAIISTGSSLVIYTLIFTLVVYSLIYSRKSILAFLVIIVSIPFLTLVLPDRILQIFKDVFNLSVPQTNVAIQTLQGSLKMIGDNLWGGIGVGESAFKNMFGLYAMPATETATGVPALLPRILSELGIGALLVFLAIIILFYQHNFEHLKSPYNFKFRNINISSITAFSSLLFAGLFYDIWSDNRLFWIFWTLIALSKVYYNVGVDEKLKQIKATKYDVIEGSIELPRKFVY